MARDLLEKVLSYTEKSESGCWLWTRAKKENGYGVVWDGSRTRYVHRVSYELFVGPIPDGLTIDHLCRVRSCLNPQHLEPVTAGENTLRGDSPAAVNARKTHCPRGHAFDHLNVDGQRRCYQCDNLRAAKRREDPKYRERMKSYLKEYRARGGQDAK